jgi:hypothetical protein
MSSTIAFYSRDWVENEFHVLVEVWTKVTILTKGSVNDMPSDPDLLEVIVHANSAIVNTMRVQIDGDLFQYSIRHIAPYGLGQYTRLVLDKNNYLELFPAPDDLGPITIHTRTNLVGFLKGDGYNVYADEDGGTGTPGDVDGGSAASTYLPEQIIDGGNA